MCRCSPRRWSPSLLILKSQLVASLLSSPLLGKQSYPMGMHLGAHPYHSFIFFFFTPMMLSEHNLLSVKKKKMMYVAVEIYNQEKHSTFIGPTVTKSTLVFLLLFYIYVDSYSACCIETPALTKKPHPHTLSARRGVQLGAIRAHLSP